MKSNFYMGFFMTKYTKAYNPQVIKRYLKDSDAYPDRVEYLAMGITALKKSDACFSAMSRIQASRSPDNSFTV